MLLPASSRNPGCDQRESDYKRDVMQQCPICSRNSEPENAGVEEKTKKSGKMLNQQLQSLNLEAEIFETKRKTSLTRSKTYDSVFPSSPADLETKSERKKNSNPSKTNATYHKIFKDIEKDESLKQSFTCALQKDILYQGKLFVSENWICFNSKVFGRDIKITIPTFSVNQIKKHKTALLVPNALCIFTELEKFMFVSLLSRDATYKLLKSVCLHLEERPDDTSPNPSLAENNFRVERPTSLSLEFHIEDLPDIPTECRRRELEQSSSSGSQTPESENSQEFPSGSQALLKMEKNTIPVHADVHVKEMTDVKRRSYHEGRNSLVWGLLHKVKANGEQHISVNTLLVLYLAIVIVLVISSFYMGMKIFALEQRLASLGALPEYHAHHKESFIQRDVGLPYQVNTDMIYDELTENLAKLEKIQKNLQKLLDGTE